ncbi:LacI family DNA-binding transcriptional regulator [Actinomyces bowdenii]|uniref:LacI family transcriptional regulator n=1 Tax=Actinomyces bowdenii TaxID=131109 RepID=A0A3P1V9G4_9ACTO|nr:LacI family DNA-binding transcriptional regulator [Actinomyces bowdenii]RRD29233.1 LacI family transcriptional regulator [Actinomyces bowdenii]
MATLAEVAALAGVSTASASLVLSGKSAGRVSAETAQRIRDAAQSLGYVRDALASGLRSKQTQTLGVVAHELLQTPYATDMVDTIVSTCRELGWSLLLTDASDPAGIEDVTRELISRRVDRVLLAAMYHHVVRVPHSMPEGTMVLNGYADRPGIPGVVPDEVQGARDAVEHLLGLGHRRIGHLTHGERGVADAIRLRLGAYAAALRDAGIRPDPDLVVGGGLKPAQADRSAAALLGRSDRPTAVFCYNDALAAGVYRQAARLGLSIPHDLSVIGFDDLRLISTNLAPGLTTMRLPHRAMADWAVRRLLEPAGPAPSLTRFHCDLIIRASTAPPPTV